MGKGRIIIRPTPMIRKQAGQMFKLFNLWEKLKNPSKFERKLMHQPTAPPIAREGKPVFLTKTQGLNTKYITRRQIVMNRHFTEIISDVLVNNLKTHLDEVGVNITSIESKAWNKGVSIFYSTSMPYDEAIHQKLNSLVRDLGDAIAERQLIGRTPRINFVYDEIAKIERDLENSLKLANIKEIEPTTEIVETTNSLKQVKSEEKSSGFSPQLNPKNFSSPPDMSNMALGLDYANLYNKVVTKLERGRGQSQRMPSGTSIASMGPMLRFPSEETTEDDSVTRIMKMQKFIVDQRKKKEFLSKLRRKQELLHRDNVKWDIPDDNPEEPPDAKLTDEIG